MSWLDSMARRHTVKARAHRGANSLDLTIPAKMCQEQGIDEGDVFTVSVEKESGKLSLRYVRLG